MIGSCVSTIKQDKLKGYKVLLLQDFSLITKDVFGNPFVAIDTVGAGQGDIVVVIEGTPAQQVFSPKVVPTDAAIIAIVDSFSLDEIGSDA